MSDQRNAVILRDYTDLFGPDPWGVQKSPMTFQFEFGEGWRSIVIDLLKELRAIVREESIDGFRVQQVREKRAALLVYVWPMPPSVRNAINWARERSMLTCEPCERPDSTRKSMGWWHTLCDACSVRRDGGHLP